MAAAASCQADSEQKRLCTGSAASWHCWLQKYTCTAVKMSLAVYALCTSLHIERQSPAYTWSTELLMMVVWLMHTQRMSVYPPASALSSAESRLDLCAVRPTCLLEASTDAAGSTVRRVAYCEGTHQIVEKAGKEPYSLCDHFILV